MNQSRMIEWIATHSVGVSSRTMWAGLMDVNTPSKDFAWRFDVPYDASDFGLCYDLVRFCDVDPVSDFPRIVVRFPWYKPVLDNWDGLCRLYESAQYLQVYEVLSKIRKEVKMIRKSI